MDFWAWLQVYLIISIALAGTSYINLYRPAINLLEEILDEKNTFYSSIWGMLLWLILSFIAAPATLVLLTVNNNDSFIERFAVSIADRVINKEDNEK